MQPFSIARGLLQRAGRPVEQIPSRNTSGPFPAPPRIVVMHYTAGGDARATARWFANPANRSASAHLVIGRDGTIIQCVGFGQIAWHAGRSRWGRLTGLNRHSIGIELANWGWLRRTPAGPWASHTGEPVANAVLAAHRNGNPDGSAAPIGWEAFPQAQLDSARAVVATLSRELGIREILGHDDIAPGRKSDPGPAFPMASFRAELPGHSAAPDFAEARVTAKSGLNLRSGPGEMYGVRAVLTQGSQVLVHAEQGRWRQVEVLPAGGAAAMAGWVHGDFLTLG